MMRAWAREHRVRAWICAALLALLALLLLGLLLGPTQSAWAADCKTRESQTKHLESAAGTNLSDTKLVVHWCWGGGQITSVDEQVKHRFVNCIDWCYNWSVADRDHGHYWLNKPTKMAVWGNITYCQGAFGFDCVNRETIRFGGWVKKGGENSFPGFSGGGGGGSWKG